jgi:hypothetical protein
MVMDHLLCSQTGGCLEHHAREAQPLPSDAMCCIVLANSNVQLAGALNIPVQHF